MTEQSLNWEEIVKKDARGNNDIELGEVKAVGQRYIMTQRGTLIKDTFYFPKYLVKGYDRQTIWLNVTEDQLERFTKEEPPVREDLNKFRTENMPAGVEAIIPGVEERLKVSKTTVTEEAIIFKEPVTEYRLIEVPVMREELRIVRKPVPTASMPADKAKEAATAGPDSGEIRILLSREEVQIIKKPYIFEEVLIRKEKVIDRKTVSDTVTKERVDTNTVAE